MPSDTVENYLKAILVVQLQAEDSTASVPMGLLARRLGVVPGTATTMAKHLEKAGLAAYAPRVGLQLTDEGRKLAIQVLRRHRLIEYFLVETLGMDWADIHDEAERLEHAISDRVLERIDALLGHPEVDPHGDPIPAADGRIPSVDTQSLADSEPGQAVVVERVLRQDPAFLQFVEETGLSPGSRVEIVRQETAGGLVEVREPGKRARRSIGREPAEQIRVRRG
ncbi:MAG: metal-dependent transcriptional regulator [Opitutales bacterium]